MIPVTRFNGTPIIINADLIEMVEANPDTVIFLTSGRKMVVSETVDELIQRIVDYKRRCYPLIGE